MGKRTAVKIARAYVRFLLAHRYKVRKAFLFGSYSKSRFNDDSDIDIALIMEGYRDNLKELSNLMRFRRNFDLRIEPHPLSKEDFEKSNPLAKEIKKGLKIL